MNAIYAMTVLLIVFALGEFIALKSKAVFSTTLVVAIGLMVGFWVGLPHDIFVTAAVDKISGVLIGILIVSMGTTIDLAELIKQWKTVLLGFAAVTVAVLTVILIGQHFVGRNLALAGAPIVAGANVAALIMTNTFSSKGLSELGVFVILVLITQNFIGIPIASYLCKKEAKQFLKRNKDSGKLTENVESKKKESKKKLIPPLPEVYQKPFIILSKLALVASLSSYISFLIQGKLNFLVICLIMGIIFSEIGFLEKNALAKSNSMGLVLFLTTVAVFGSLPKATPQVLASMIMPLIVVLILGVVGIGITALILSKPLKMSFNLSFALGLSCMFGFPTTYFIPEEVSEAVGTTDEEKAAIKDYMMPKMLSAGFATVSIASVIIVGFVAAMI